MMKQHLSTDAGKELTEKIGLVYQIKVSPKKLGFEEVTCIVDLKKGEVTKGRYEGGKVDATFSFKDDDFVKVATGKMNPHIAFIRGAMKIKGSLSAAQEASDSEGVAEQDCDNVLIRLQLEIHSLMVMKPLLDW
ncbi:hypothetical protein F2Q69_00034615 [Brassica cretica]|uniref:SCP2 domain-containing protein n=1 Tax=Brassica cretica TaxID=69181 RepID=A0A8S9SL00_BRACR|nr:hypothetical protein F2Q69_00034615 [Brassica cretica]